MGSLSIWHWMIVLAVGLLLFGGRGKVSDLMGDVAKGIKSFKKGLQDDDAVSTDIGCDNPKQIVRQAGSAVDPVSAQAEGRV